MCGFVGVLERDGRTVSLPLLTHMANAVAHRGPDDEGHLIDGPLGLYHKRLSIIDLETGQQPMTSGSASVVFNGEIYNYRELRDDLKRRGHCFQTSSDTEVILAMYAEYGDACVAWLNGMFAFLLYDRARRRLLAARDHFGIKPLYYWASDREVLFASEIKSLLRHPSVRATVDQASLRDYITFQFVLGDGTLFGGVRKVMPGHRLVLDIDSGEMEIARYWEPRFVPDIFHTEEYFTHEVQRLVDDSVRLQVRSDVPIGTHLSGGMDSSLITTLASRHVGGPLRSYSGAFREGPEFDETAYARQVAEACGACLVTAYCSEQDFVDLLPKLVYHLDEPVAGPGVLPQYVVARAAAQDVKVVLGGQGGDEVFGGYARYLVAYLEQALKGAIYETNEEREHIVSLLSIVPNLPYLREYVPMLRRFWSTDLFEPMDARYFRLIDRSVGMLRALSGDALACYQREEIFARFQEVFNHPDTLSYYSKMTHFDIAASLPALLQVEDRVSMASSIETRVPFLDPRLVDLITTMPPGVKFRAGELKYILKRALGSLLPPDVLARKDKMGFPVPLHRWTTGIGGEFIRDILLSPTCRQRGLFNPTHVERLVRSEDAFGRGLWGLLNVELWYREFIDREQPSAS